MEGVTRPPGEHYGLPKEERPKSTTAVIENLIEYLGGSELLGKCAVALYNNTESNQHILDALASQQITSITRLNKSHSGDSTTKKRKTSDGEEMIVDLNNDVGEGASTSTNELPCAGGNGSEQGGEQSLSLDWVFSVVSGTREASLILATYWDCVNNGFCLRINSRALIVDQRRLPSFLKLHKAVTCIRTFDLEEEKDYDFQREHILASEDDHGESGQIWLVWVKQKYAPTFMSNYPEDVNLL